MSVDIETRDGAAEIGRGSRTPRLRLIAATEQHVRAELDSLDTFRALINFDVSASWPPGQYDRDAQEFFLQSLVTGGTAASGE